MQRLFEIVHEDDTLLVINKPAGLVCHPTKGDDWSSLIGRIRLHLGPGAKPHLINRLDRETSGVVIVAKEEMTARVWRRQWERGDVGKTYFAIVHGTAPASGAIEAPLGKDERSEVVIKDTVRPDGAPARTGFELVRHFTRAEGAFSLLRVLPQSGRKHQIRIHLAHAGHPIVGDKLYGGDERCYLDFVQGCLSEQQRQRLLTEHHCLHAQSIDCRGDAGTAHFEASPEAAFVAFLS